MAFEEGLYLPYSLISTPFECPTFSSFDPFSMVVVAKPSPLLYATLDSQQQTILAGTNCRVHCILLPTTLVEEVIRIDFIPVISSFLLSLARTAIAHAPHSIECLGTGHQVVVLVFLEALAVSQSCLVQVLEVVLAALAQMEFVLEAPEGFSRVLLEHGLVLSILEPLQLV